MFSTEFLGHAGLAMAVSGFDWICNGLATKGESAGNGRRNERDYLGFPPYRRVVYSPLGLQLDILPSARWDQSQEHSHNDNGEASHTREINGAQD